MSQDTAETKDNETGLENPNDKSMAAFSPQMTELEDALSLLYIRKNASGRHKFRNKWPDVALYLFGETLIKYDYEGTQDWDHRSKLEEEAGQRRILLKETIKELIDKSVDSGVLQFDYVGAIIDRFGAGLSKSLYAEDIIERVRPGQLAAIEAEQNNDESGKDEKVSVNTLPPITDDETAPLSSEEKQILSNAPAAETQTEDIETRVSVSFPPPSKAEPSQSNDPPPTDDPFDSVHPIETASAETLPVDGAATKEPAQSGDLEDVAKNDTAETSTNASTPTVAKGTYVDLFNAVALSVVSP